MTYCLLRWVWRLFSLIPLRVIHILSDGIFYPVYYLFRYRRKITRNNLIESFPEKSEREIVTIEKRFYRFFIDVMLEMSKLTSFSPKKMTEHMRFTHMERLNAVLQQGKSVSLYLGHYGNWEWISSLPLHLNKESGVIAGQIYKKLRNKPIDKLLIYNREHMGAVCIEMNQTLRWINEQMNNNVVTITGYIADQSPRKSQNQHYVPFLHRYTPVLTGAEKITKRYGFEAWYLDVKRLKRGYYEATFVQLHDQPQSLPDFDLTDSYYRHLEQSILRQPELYLWTHNRFKHAKKT